MDRLMLALLLAIVVLNGYDLGSSLFFLPPCITQRSLAQCEHNQLVPLLTPVVGLAPAMNLIKAGMLVPAVIAALAQRAWEVRFALLIGLLMLGVAGLVNQVLVAVVR